jgi:hypothetical protein
VGRRAARTRGGPRPRRQAHASGGSVDVAPGRQYLNPGAWFDAGTRSPPTSAALPLRSRHLTPAQSLSNQSRRRGGSRPRRR